MNRANRRPRQCWIGALQIGANLFCTEIATLFLDLKNRLTTCRFDPVRTTSRSSTPLLDSLPAFTGITVQQLIAGLPSDPELLAQAGHRNGSLQHSLLV